MLQARKKAPIVIAIDGTSASGKSTNSKLVAKALSFVHVDTGAMYRTLAWHCLRQNIDVQNAKAVSAACRRWKTSLECADGSAYLAVDGYYPASEIRTAEVSAAVSHVAAVAKVREWMKKTQRECIKFGSLVMEGQENLAARDQRDSQRAAAPLMVALGARVINNSQMTSEQTSSMILADIRERLAELEKIAANRQKAGMA